MILQLSDLTIIHEAAKALKAKSILWHQNVVANIDFYGTKDSVTYIDPSQLQSMPQRALRIETKDLSAFLKSVVLTEFEIDERLTREKNVWLESGTAGYLEIGISIIYDEWMKNILCRVSNLELMHYPPEDDVTQEFERLFKVTKDSGSMLFNHNKYAMYLFSGVLPLLKGDKIFISIIDASPTVFNARFRIIKKSGFVVYVYINFLNMLAGSSFYQTV